MPPKFTFEFVKDFIENSGEKLVSKEYINANTVLIIECNKCNKNYEQFFNRYKRGNRHGSCPNRENPLLKWNKEREKTAKPKQKICEYCGEEFTIKYRNTNQIVCDIECRKGLETLKAADGHYKSIGHLGGKISATAQARRSKNEIAFAELCMKQFPFEDILCNEPIFEGWDADVVLNKIKVAILWNGIWHYKQVRKDHSLEQVQSRDKIKSKIINKMGYKIYIIKDMGSENSKFVKQEFEKFCNFIYFI